jgi:hypothetical protein
MDPQPGRPLSSERVELFGARQTKVVTFQSPAGVQLEDASNIHHEDFGCARFFVFAMVLEIGVLIAILLR